MATLIRQANPADADRWLDLFQMVFGRDYPAKAVYDPEWVASQLDPANGYETWIAEADGQWQASVSFLPSAAPNKNPVANLGRQLIRPESYADGSAVALLQRINELAAERGQMVVFRVLGPDAAQQGLIEQLGYACAGYQPFKHFHRSREGVLFYVRIGRPDLVTRLPLSESLPQIKELAGVVLEHLHIPNPLSVLDGVTGYPLQGELEVHDASFDDFGLWHLQAQAGNPPIEISGGFNRGCGLLRIPSAAPMRALLGQRGAEIVAGLAYLFDEQDRCVRILDAFAIDDLSPGILLQRVLRIAQEQLNAVYVEMDVLMTAPRLLKSTEQLGFVPIAYLPGFFYKDGRCADVVKLVKLNLVYALETAPLTPLTQAVVEVINRNFEEQKVGLAVINLLRALPVFQGLGDGELRKVARLFQQKLYRPSEKIFNKGDGGHEAYVVMRGQIDIFLDELAKPVASVAAGQIFGEFAFLEDTPRVAMALASQATILLVIHRQAFNELIQREPHLGLVVLRNMALDLSNKLRRANATMSQMRR